MPIILHLFSKCKVKTKIQTCFLYGDNLRQYWLSWFTTDSVLLLFSQTKLFYHNNNNFNELSSFSHWQTKSPSLPLSILRVYVKCFPDFKWSQINWKVGLRGKNVPLLGSRSPLCKTIISQIKFSVFNTREKKLRDWSDKLPSSKLKYKLRNSFLSHHFIKFIYTQNIINKQQPEKESNIYFPPI